MLYRLHRLAGLLENSSLEIAAALPKRRAAERFGITQHTIFLAVCLSTLLFDQYATAQKQDVSWLFPTDEALVAAAKKGHEGGKVKPIRIFVRCLSADCVSEVDIMPPLHAAFALGVERRKKFDPMPTEQEILQLKGSLLLNLVFESGKSDLDAEAAIAQGDRLIKSSEKHVLSREVSTCQVLLSRIDCWQTEIAYRFDFASSTDVPKGKASLLVRRRDGKEHKIDLDFDRVARASLQNASH